MFEPRATNFDLKFSIMGIPVRVHPFFWVMVLLFGMQGSGRTMVVNLIAWGMAVFISILAHEMGHALTGRLFGSDRVHIIIHGFGGLAMGARGRSKWQDIQISAAGPGMGFILALPFVIMLFKAGYMPGWMEAIPGLVDIVDSLISATGGAIVITNEFLLRFTIYMAFVNVVWGIINLLPVYPLDGGQIMNEVIGGSQLFGGPTELANKISIGVAVLVASLLLYYRMPFAAILFGYLAYLNYRMMQRPNHY